MTSRAASYETGEIRRPETALLDLQVLTRRLRFIAALVPLSSAIALAFWITTIALVALNPNFYAWVVAAWVSGSGLTSLVPIALSVIFDNLRRRGDIAFSEISDGLEWEARLAGTTHSYRVSQPGTVRAALRPERLALREFARASELPLAPGRYGPALYVGLNVLNLLAGVGLTFAQT